MNTLATLLLDKTNAWSCIIVTIFIGVLSAWLAASVEQDDDLLAFLPEGNADIEAFNEINARFGGMDIALVGIEDEDIFDASFLGSLKQATKDLKSVEGVDYVLSLTTIEDFVEDPMGGIVTTHLIDKLPSSPQEKETLRTHVLSRDHVVGQLVSAEGNAVLLYVFAGYGSDTRLLANNVQKVVSSHFDADKLYFGGAPFVSSYIYDASQADLKWLTPWAVIAIIGIILLSFRDVLGSILALVATGLGVLVSRAAMALLGVSFNIVLSAMPIILFAVGSAYSIHILSRFYQLSEQMDRQAALHKTLTTTGPVVLAAGFTTVAGLLSFITMDIAPMRTFGIFTALGILTTLILSVTFVPSVISVSRISRKSIDNPLFQRLTRGLAGLAHKAPRRTLGALIALMIVAGTYAGQVDNRMDQSAFFAEGSPPDRAQQFLDQHFGGSQFLQLHVKAELRNPEVLRELQRLTDAILLVPRVTQVLSIQQAVQTINEAMDGVRRIPDTPEQLQLLYGLMTGQPALSQLVTAEFDEGLIHIKIDSNQADDLDMKQRQHSLLEARVAALAKQSSVTLPVGWQEELADSMGLFKDTLSSEPVLLELRDFLLSEECFVQLTEEQAMAVAQATVDVGPALKGETWRAALSSTLAQMQITGDLDLTSMQEGLSPELTEEGLAIMVDDLMIASESTTTQIWRQHRASLRAQSYTQALGLKQQGLQDKIATAFMDLDNPAVMVASRGVESKAIDVEVNGLPLLYRGLSESVTANQLKSLFTALLLVFLILSGLFRSMRTGLLATLPTGLTLLFVYGAMGAMGVHLDIGTSMLASLIIGAGVDYAVHFVSALQNAPADDGMTALAHAVQDTAPAIWTNALMVAVGFFILTLGEAKPLQNVGGLTAAAMLIAALATFIAVPLFSPKRPSTL
jgi:predicted RND superfamily exporter protein